MSLWRSARGRALAVLVVVIIAGAAGAHTTSRGALFLRLDDQGVLSVRLDLQDTDTLDLFDVDAASEREAPRVAPAIAEALPRYLRFSGDGAPCPLQFDGVERRGVRTLVVTATARCPQPPEALVVDWGFSAVSTLDLVTLATLEAPDELRHTTVFSRRSPRERFVVKRESHTTTLGRFLVLGVEHIATGFDHLAFLLALLLGCATLGRLLVVVTAFTLAHSVTLVLGALDLVTVRPELVEPVIALSIVVAALLRAARLRRPDAAWPGRRDVAPGSIAVEAGLAFAFGLVHGLGFASMLQEALGDAGRIGTSLVGFNLGVELGQVAAVAVAFPLVARLGRAPHGRRALMLVAAALVVVGAYWLVERVV